MANKEKLGSTRDRYYGLRDSFAGHPVQRGEQEGTKNIDAEVASVINHKVDKGKVRAMRAFGVSKK